MSNRAVMLSTYALGLGCLFLLIDSLLSGFAVSALEMSSERVRQAAVIYGFGAFSAVLGILLFGSSLRD